MLRKAVLILVVVLFVMPMAAYAQTGGSDPEEFNLEIPALESGDEITNIFEGSVTSHLYVFDATAGDVVTISMTQAEGSTLDPLLVLLGPAGQVIASDDDSGEAPLSALIDGAEIPADGSYFILATSFTYIDVILVEDEEEVSEELEGAEYTLTLEGANRFAGSNEDTFTLYQTELVIGDSFEGYSNADEPVYYFTFDARAGDVVNVEVTSDDIDTLLYVFAPDGNRIAVNDDDPDTIGTNSAIRGLELPVDGEYLIFATDVFFYRLADEATSVEYEGGVFTISLSAAE